ncbi:MAG: DegV family protein [Anaerolineae bacterium]|jgi:DegV family protein with EDD domain|nr:DegV family protein [Anaerolineae bacterium]
MSVRVVTDSTVYLSPDLVRKLDITVVPFHLRIGDRNYLDGVNLDNDEFHHLVYEQGLQPSTSSPTVENFRRVYEGLNRKTSEIISIHLAETLSTTLNNAQQAAGMLLGQCHIETVDSKTVSLGLGILVEAAARAAAAGRPLDEIVRLVRGLISQIYVVFFSESLAYLESGGRIGHAQALLGTILGIKPFLTLEEGEILPIEKVRTREQALEKLVEFVAEFDAIKQLAIVKGKANLTEETDQLIERLQGVFPGLEIPVISYGPVLASHIGPGTLGIIVQEDS